MKSLLFLVALPCVLSAVELPAVRPFDHRLPALSLDAVPATPSSPANVDEPVIDIGATGPRVSSAGKRVSRMPILRPSASLDSKLQVVSPSTETEFKLLVVEPTVESVK